MLNGAAHRKYFKVLVFGGILILAAVFYLKSSETMNENQSETLTVNLRRQVFSTDPNDFDFLTHHVALKSVFGTLTTKHHKLGLKGIISDSWSISDDWTSWTFNIRKDIRFENNDIISPEYVQKSFLRLAVQLHRKKSKNPVLESIVGFEKLKDMSSTLEGLIYDSTSLTFNFKEPQKNLLYDLAFGYYTVTHPDMYDSVTGDWKNKKDFVSSGAYKIGVFSEEKFTLELREDFPKDLYHPAAYSRIEFVWPRKFNNDGNDSDIYIGENIDKFPGYSFLGSEVSGILFGRIISWSNKDNLWSSLEFRRKLRAKFYQGMESLGVEHNKNFLPLSVAETKPIIDNPSNDQNIDSDSKTKFRVLELKKNKSWIGDHTIQDLFGESIALLGLTPEEADCNSKKIRSNYIADQKNHCLDFLIRGTAVNVRFPKGSLKYMVKSDQGIMLPDPSGRLAKLFDAKQFDYQKVNEIIWDDAIIWPIGHFSVSLWYRAERLDLSSLSINTVPVDFSWIGAKK